MTAATAGQDFARVIHPTDLSSESDLAFAHGVKIALAAKGRLSIVHTGHGLEVGNEWRAFPKVRERLARWGVLPGSASEEDVLQLGLHVNKADLDATDPARAVSAYAELHGCDLIVLAAHVRHGMERLITPAVAEPLARSTGSLTLFLPEGTTGFVDPQSGKVGLKNILVPVATSPDPGRAVDLAISLARLMGVGDAVIHLLHIGPDEPRISGDLTGADVRRVVAPAGPIVGTICDVAANLNADLIVMATSGHDDFLDVLRGSTTEQVLRNANRAVLAVPER